MSDFGTMKSRISDELARDDLSAYIARAIQSAITHYGRKRFFFNEGVGTFSTVQGQESYGTADSVPTDIKDIDLLEAAVSGYQYSIEKRTYKYIQDQNWGTSTWQGQPQDYAFYNEKFYLYPYPAAAYVVTVSYLKELAALSDDADTNAWMTDGEELIRQRAKADLQHNVIMEQAPQIIGDFLSPLEKVAYGSLLGETVNKVSSGKFRPTVF